MYDPILDARSFLTRRDVCEIIRIGLRRVNELQAENAALRRALEEQWGCECRTDDPPENYR